MASSGFEVRIGEDGGVLAMGPGMLRELGWVHAGPATGWQATGPDRQPLLTHPVGTRDRAVQALVRHAGLGIDYEVVVESGIPAPWWSQTDPQGPARD